MICRKCFGAGRTTAGVGIDGGWSCCRLCSSVKERLRRRASGERGAGRRKILLGSLGSDRGMNEGPPSSSSSSSSSSKLRARSNSAQPASYSARFLKGLPGPKLSSDAIALRTGCGASFRVPASSGGRCRGEMIAVRMARIVSKG